MTKENTTTAGPPLVIGGSLVGHPNLVGPPPPATRRSYAVCRALTARANSSFPVAFRLLPPHKRRAMDALYAFMRVTDDLADEDGTTRVKRQNLAVWRAALVGALDGHFSHPIHPALAHAVHRFEIPPRHLLDVIDGVESDLEFLPFATFAELYPYCYRVASAVGLACVRVWGVRPGATFADAEGPAEAAGIAFQLTNILRDVGEDLSHGRVYLPADELREAGSPPESWHDPNSRPAFARMMAAQAERAHGYYQRAAELERVLSADGRGIFRVMCGTYRRLLTEIEGSGFDVLCRRVRVPKWRKGLILLRGWAARLGWD